MAAVTPGVVPPRGRQAFGAVLLLALGGAAWLGCAAPKIRRPTGDRLTELHLFGVPVALELNGRPGPDGLGVRIYATAGPAARGIAIRRGTLDILMFEGPVDPALIASLPAQQVWSFSAANLSTLAAETSLGIGYQLALRWEKAPPREPLVTVVARYRSPEGQIFYSTADAIAISPK